MNKYDEIMTHVQVTDEIRSRVLSNVDQYFERKQKRAVLQRYIYRFGAAAAAAAVLLVIGLTLSRQGLIPQNGIGSGSESDGTYESEGSSVAGGFSVKDCASAAELAKTVGFSVPTLTRLPFEVESTAYTAIGDDLAQVTCYSKDGTNELVLRKAPGTEDISGDYNTYAESDMLNISGTEVSVKGNDGLLYLACWNDGEYSYSVSVSAGCEKDVLTEMLEEIIRK